MEVNSSQESIEANGTKLVWNFSESDYEEFSEGVSSTEFYTIQ